MKSLGRSGWVWMVAGMGLFMSCSGRSGVPSAPQASQTESAAKAEEKKIVPPEPPLKLAEPAEPPAVYNNVDLKNEHEDRLRWLASVLQDDGNYEVAAIVQYWYVRKSGEGKYNLACYEARRGHVDAALYWLQKAGMDEGVDVQHARRDPDLESVRADPRWDQILEYFVACNHYFFDSGLTKTCLVLPTGYDKSKAIPAVVWMHGYGSQPADFVGESRQKFADQLQVALIGVSATRAVGPRSFVWANDVVLDLKRVQAGLAEVSDRVTIEKGKVIAMGFSQGAQMGLEIVAHSPEEFAGAIVLSPGAESGLKSIRAKPLLAKRGFVVSYGLKEMRGNVNLATEDVVWLRRANAQVKHVPYEDVSAHALPADFDERFPEWVKFILDVK